MSIKLPATLLRAKVALHKLMADGTIKERVITIKPRNSLVQKSGRSEYEGFEVDAISYGGAFVRFANTVEVRKGEAVGSEKEAIFEAQIRYTVEEHFRKQARLRDQGIKILSLFFVDKVDNYASEEGIIRQLFIKAFDKLKRGDCQWADKQPMAVQAAYFASKRRRGGEIEMLDTSGKTKEDEGAFNLIMRDKERLLSFDEDVAFIFSHSALREGWDNPNIFQICTLREVASEIEQRQLVGRGVRLPVDQAGNRVTDERINVLTVIASESFERFVSGLQSEIEAEYGKDGIPPKPANARKRAKAILRKHYLLKPEFRDLWERIKHKTRYAVQVDSAKLITDVVPELDRAVIRKPRVTISKAEVIASTKDTFEAMTQSGARTAIDLAGRYPLPNLVEIMETLMEHTSPSMRLSRRTLLEIFRRTSNKQAALDNPHDFAIAAVNIIKDKLADQLVEGIRYENLNEWYEMSLFNDQAVIETWEEYLIKSERPDGSEGACLYDHVIWDSETVEKPFIEALEKRNDVCLYVKLPGWFTVRTPIGSYNPDWAIVIKNPEPDGEPLLYLVRETKHTTNLSELRPDEKRKIACGLRHFEDALGVNYRVVSNAAELPVGGT